MLVLTLVVLPRAEAGEVLDGVKARGQVRCGVSEGIPGFSERDADRSAGTDSTWTSVARWRPRSWAIRTRSRSCRCSASARFPVLQTHRIDLLLGNTTWTLTREAVLRVQFPGILFFDGQGFMVPAAAGIATLADLNGATVCVEKGTTHQRNLTDYFRTNGWSVEPLVIDSAPKAAAAFFAGDCRAYTSDSAQLAAMRLLAPGDPRAFLILPERISKEPLSPVVWGGDPEWTTLIRWVLNVLILAEQHGVTRDNLDAVIAEGSQPPGAGDRRRAGLAGALDGCHARLGAAGRAGRRQLWRDLRAQRRARQSAQDRARSQPALEPGRTPLCAVD